MSGRTGWRGLTITRQPTRAPSTVIVLILGETITMTILKRSVRAWSVAALLSTAASAALSAEFEAFQPRPVQEVVSPGWISGPHYRMAPTVRTFDFLNEFVVSSDYG